MNIHYHRHETEHADNKAWTVSELDTGNKLRVQITFPGKGDDKLIGLMDSLLTATMGAARQLMKDPLSEHEVAMRVSERGMIGMHLEFALELCEKFNLHGLRIAVGQTLSQWRLAEIHLTAGENPALSKGDRVDDCEQARLKWARDRAAAFEITDELQIASLGVDCFSAGWEAAMKHVWLEHWLNTTLEQETVALEGPVLYGRHQLRSAAEVEKQFGPPPGTLGADPKKPASATPTCTCPIDVLMARGCQCGATNAESKRD